MNDQLFKTSNLIIEVTITGSSRINASNGVHYCRVVTTAEVTADLTEAESCVLSGEIHPDLSRKCNGLVPTF